MSENKVLEKLDQLRAEVADLSVHVRQLTNQGQSNEQVHKFVIDSRAGKNICRKSYR